MFCNIAPHSRCILSVFKSQPLNAETATNRGVCMSFRYRDKADLDEFFMMSGRIISYFRNFITSPLKFDRDIFIF